MSCNRLAPLSRLLPAAGAVLAMLAPTAGALAVDAPALPPRDVLELHGRTVAQIVQNQLLPHPTKAEQERVPLLVKALLQQRTANTGSLAGRQLQPLERRDALRRALEKNLSLAIGRVNPERTQKLIQEAKAVFDPVFDLQIGYTRNDTYLRTRVGTVIPKSMIAVVGPPYGLTSTAADNLNTRLNFCAEFGAQYCAKSVPVIEFIEFYYNTSTAPIQEEIVASPGRTANHGHPVQKISYTLGLTQQLPWGGTATLTDQTIQQKVYYDGTHYWEDGQFTTNLTGALSMPLPFTRAFGTDNPNNAAIRNAEIARKSADWELKGLINQTLRDVDQAYYEVVRQVETLETTVHIRDLIAQLRQKTHRLYDQQLATVYQKAQMDAELNKAELRVEQALQGYVNASVALASLIGEPDVQRRSQLYFPFAYSHDLGQQTSVATDNLLATARENRPELAVAKYGRETAGVNQALAENLARPNVVAGANLTSSQNGSTYGFSDPAHSHANIVTPDNLNQTYSLTYTYPWMNRAAEAGVEKAKISAQDQDLAVRGTESGIRREITDRLAALQSARARVKLNGEEAKQLRSAFANLEKQLEVGLVGEDQVILALRNLLNAELAALGAQVDGKQAESALLAAQGIIANVLPVQTAQTPFDQHRLKLLADAGQLSYFGAPRTAGDQAQQKKKP